MFDPHPSSNVPEDSTVKTVGGGNVVSRHVKNQQIQGPPIRPSCSSRATTTTHPRDCSRSPPSHTHHDLRRTLIFHRRTNGNTPDGTRPSHEGCPMGIRRASPCAQAARHANAGGHIHPVTVSVLATLTAVRQRKIRFSCFYHESSASAVHPPFLFIQPCTTRDRPADRRLDIWTTR